MRGYVFKEAAVHGVKERSNHNSVITHYFVFLLLYNKKMIHTDLYVGYSVSQCDS